MLKIRKRFPYRLAIAGGCVIAVAAIASVGILRVQPQGATTEVTSVKEQTGSKKKTVDKKAEKSKNNQQKLKAAQPAATSGADTAAASGWSSAALGNQSNSWSRQTQPRQASRSSSAGATQETPAAQPQPAASGDSAAAPREEKCAVAVPLTDVCTDIKL